MSENDGSIALVPSEPVSEEAEQQTRLLYNAYNVDGPARRQRKATPAIKQKFCEALAGGASVTKVCAALEISTAAMYYQRSNDIEFREAWADALERAADRYEDRLDELTMESTHPAPVIFQLKNRRPSRWQDRKDVKVEQYHEHHHSLEMPDVALTRLLEIVQTRLLEKQKLLPPPENSTTGSQKRSHAS